MRYVKIIMAVLLLLCLLPMPYGYFVLVRFVAMCAFAYLAFCYYSANQKSLAYVFGALAILFQPIFKIALGRTMWNVVDVIVALGLLLLVIKSK